jgi:hypothetical protein
MRQLAYVLNERWLDPLSTRWHSRLIRLAETINACYILEFEVEAIIIYDGWSLVSLKQTMTD